MDGIQWVGLLAVVAGIAWAFLHPKETGASEVGFKGISAKGLTQGGVIVFAGVVLLVAPLLAGQDDGSGDTATTARRADDACHVAGIVYERDTRQPFGGVDVGLVPPGSAFTDEELVRGAATTDPGGRFDFDCSALLGPGERAVLALSQPGWGGCINVVERPVTAATDVAQVTIYVSQRVQEFLGKAFGLPKNDNCERPAPSAG